MKYYEVSFEEIQLNRPPRLCKFLVELKNTQGDAIDQSKAIAVAKKAGGVALRTDFQMKMSQAKLVQIDPAELDSGESITIDDCRVWILEKPSGGA
jgi:hypothetical protein